MPMTEFEAFQGLIINDSVRIAHGIIFPVGLIIGSIFYWGTIYYERYGSDPMKRTIQNKLVSAMAFSMIMLCYTNNIGLAWRIQIGPLSDNVAMMVLCNGLFFESFLILNMSEIIIYKVITSRNVEFRNLIFKTIIYQSILGFGTKVLGSCLCYR